MGLHAEFARFPVVVCRLTAERRPDSSEQLLQACDAMLVELQNHRGIFVCVHDWTQLGELEEPGFRLVFERLVLAPALATRCVAQSIAVSSPALRGFATARSMQHRTPYPVRIASSLETATSWCTWQLRRSEPEAV